MCMAKILSRYKKDEEDLTGGGKEIDLKKVEKVIKEADKKVP